jgi:hypothetical protein
MISYLPIINVGTYFLNDPCCIPAKDHWETGGKRRIDDPLDNIASSCTQINGIDSGGQHPQANLCSANR